MTAHGFRRTPFASRLLRHAMRDRARRETGSPASSTSPMFDDWREGIHAWIRQRTADLVAEGGIRLHVEDDNGRTGLVLVEVKLSEGGFTHCNGTRSVANKRKDVCASAATFFDDPRACYLRRTRHARRDRRYWDIFDAAFGSVRAAVPGFTGERCPFEGDHQQLMRNHALALGLIQAGEVAFAAFGLVHHPDNHHVVEPWEHYRSLVADASPLFRIPATELINAAADQSAPWSDWACYMRERYMLARNGTSE